MFTHFDPEAIRGLAEKRRLKRIAEILYDAVLLSESGPGANAAAGSDRDPRGDPILGSEEASDASAEARVVNLLSQRGNASPLEVRATLGLSRTSAYRVLNRLVSAGRIVAAGQTRALMYRLIPAPPDKRVLGNN